MSILSKALAMAVCISSLSGPAHAGGAAETASFKTFDQKAQTGESLSVAFLGGSLTWGANASDPNRTSWRALMADHLRERYPKARFRFHDAAIGGTGSSLGMFRLERDVLAHSPDLVFLDFTINDNISGTDVQHLASYEELLRTMIGRGIPVMQVLTCGSWNLGKKFDPDSLTRRVAHLKLAETYGTAVADIVLHFQKQIEAGKTTVKECYPFDGIHPGDRGYAVFYESVRDAFAAAVAAGTACRLPEASVHPRLYARRERTELVALPSLPQGWSRTKTYRTSLWFDGLASRWMGDVAICDAKGSGPIEPLTLEFDGSFVGVFGEANAEGLSFRALVDGQPLTHPKRAPEGIWKANTSRFGKGNLFIWITLSDSLSDGHHILSIEPIIPGETPKGQLRIGSICTAGKTE